LGWWAAHLQQPDTTEYERALVLSALFFVAVLSASVVDYFTGEIL